MRIKTAWLVNIKHIRKFIPYTWATNDHPLINDYIGYCIDKPNEGVVRLREQDMIMTSLWNFTFGSVDHASPNQEAHEVATILSINSWRHKPHSTHKNHSAKKKGPKQGKPLIHSLPNSLLQNPIFHIETHK